MAGHSKWANIKHKKGAADAKRGKIFSKIAKEIMVSARDSGGDPGANITLRTLIQKARGVNMPADNIDRAIKKGTGELDDGNSFEEIFYEGYAAGGVGLLVQVLTDNKNRSAAEVRHCFTKANNNMAAQGAVSRSFHRKGLINVTAEGVDEDALMELVLEKGAEDFQQDGDYFAITTEPSDFAPVLEAVTEAGFTADNSELTFLPDTFFPISEQGPAASLIKFIDALEELEDVQNVFHTAEIDDAILDALSEE